MLEQAKIWRPPALQNLEVFHASYRAHAFPRHLHEEFCISIVVEGAEAVKYRGATHTAPRGSIVVLQPDEGHSKWAAGDEGWSFKVLYLPIQVFQQFSQEETEKLSLPSFASPMICDRPLFQQLKRFHQCLEQPGNCDRLKLQTDLMTILQALVDRHAVGETQGKRKDKSDSWIVQRIKDYLHAHYCQDPTLENLSHWCGLSPFHLTRVFSRSIGLPPHAYLTHLRITQAKLRLRQKQPLTQIAIELGFVDQSHFTKTFKAWVGVTPGQYRLHVQD